MDPPPVTSQSIPGPSLSVHWGTGRDDGSGGGPYDRMRPTGPLMSSNRPSDRYDHTPLNPPVGRWDRGDRPVSIR